MAKQLSFDILFTNLLSKLKISGKVVEISGHFGPDKDIREMFDYVWNMEYVHHNMSVSLLDRGKSDETSETYRQEGNGFYTKKDLMKALEYYNKSILCSPNYTYSSGKDVENFIRKDSKNLALAYANRSAVLLELKYYENCLLDIKRSYDYGYPSLTKFKLIEREAKCLIALNEMEKAKAVLENGISFLKNLNLKKEKLADICKPLKELLDNCITLKETGKQCCEENSKTNLIFDVPKCPQIESKNLEIPCLSNALGLAYAPEKGRYIIANRDIMPGEILVSEKCFSSIILPQSLNSHCSYCIRRTYIPIPCPNCSFVVFCSENCLSKGMDSFHNIECSILPSMIALEFGKNPMLALRMIIEMPLQELKKKVSKYLEENNDDPMRLGFNDNIYLSEDYRTIFHLVTNKDKRSVSDLFKRIVKTTCLVKLLLKTSYFGSLFPNLNEKETQITEDISFVGFVLSAHLMNLPCNAHSIAELAVNVKSYQQSVMEEIGAGVFGVLSLINHSCSPSISRSCYGSGVMAYAITFVPKGAEIFDCYGEHYSMNAKSERQEEIRHQYYFDCCCDACSNNWSLYNDMKSETFVKCLECSSPVSLEAQICPNCKISTSKMLAPSRTSGNNSQGLYFNIKKSIKLFNITYKNVLQGTSTDEDIEHLLDLTFYLSKHAVLPNKLLFEVQETLKHCYDRKALHYDI